MRRKHKHTVPSKYILLILTILCSLLIFFSLTANINSGPLNTIAGYVFIPMQKGINQVGLWVSDKMETFKSLNEVLNENEELQAKIDQLTTELNTIKLEQYELENLRELLELDQKYPSYEKVAADVVGKDSGNWFSTFTIDKGSNDGIEVDMNVISGSGLVGIVTEVGPNFAKVRSIIDDTSNTSGMILTTSDRCVVKGDLATMTEKQNILFSDLRDVDEEVNVGDPVVTSYISSKYLQGILIGYISTMETDANNLTKSGTITPAVDFEHIQEVLVILEKKEAGTD